MGNFLSGGQNQAQQFLCSEGTIPGNQKKEAVLDVERALCVFSESTKAPGPVAWVFLLESEIGACGGE